MNHTLVMVYVELDATNEEIKEKMQAMKIARESNETEHVVCLLDGFDKDKRFLGEIPEARAICRRLVTQGFLSYLDYSTLLPGCDPSVNLSWGAFEVWLCGEGRFKQTIEWTQTDLDKTMKRFNSVLQEANEKVDAMFGKLRPRS